MCLLVVLAWLYPTIESQVCLSERCSTHGAESLPSLIISFSAPLKAWILWGKSSATFKLSVCIQGEANALKDPVGNVLCSVKISFKNQANAHRIPSQGGRVHRCPEGILKKRRGKDTE